MNRNVLKIVAAALAVSMVLPIAACRKKNQGRKIDADSPWYDAEQIDVELGVDESKQIDYMYQQYAGGDEEYLVIFTSGSYYIDYDHIDWDTYNYNDYAINYITVIDKETKETVNAFNLTSFLGENDYANSAVYSGGKITLMASSWDPVTYDSLTKEIIVDPATGSVLDIVELKSEESGSIERTFQIGEYRIDTEYCWGETSNDYYNLYITGPDGNKEKLTLKESGTDIWDIAMILGLSDTTALVPCSTNDDNIYYEIDFETLNAKKVDEEDYEWLDDVELYSAVTAPDGMVYFTDSTGISRLNLDEKEIETFFNFSWCNINRSILSNLSVVDSSEDSFTLCGQYYPTEAFSKGSYNVGEFVIIEFTKADSNPHAGKDVLELYTPYGYIDETTGDAILEFNEDNGKYFIEVTDRYSEDDYYDEFYDDDDEINSDDEWEEVSLNANAAISNDLAMDIMNGDGPDILMNTSSFGQLNDSAYLADLSKYVEQLDSDKYFMNIIDGARTDGKLYQVPISFSIEGIQTDPSYAGDSGVGFTTEEYEDFLKNTLNGEDIITSGQAHYFAKLFTNMSDKFIVNGKVDFSGPEFEALAEYVRDNVRETAKTYDEMYNNDDYYFYDSDYDEQVAIYTTCYGYSSYLYNASELQGPSTILGLPSADGRGPMYAPNTSIAVSAQAYDIDACGEFVKLLLGDNAQRKIAMNDSFVVNREIFREVGEKAVDYYSGEGKDELYGYYYGFGGLDDSQRDLVSMDMLDDLEEVIESCSRMNTADSAINLILIEEMPAYFSGQKDLDDVIKIMQDKIQTILNERK